MTRPVRPASPIAEVRGTRKAVESLAKRPAPVVETTATGSRAILAIPPGTQVASTGSLVVITGSWTRASESGTALTAEGANNRIKVNETGVYVVKIVVVLSAVGTYEVTTYIGYTGGNSFEDVGYSSHVHTKNANFENLSHTDLVTVSSLPQNFNAQVRQDSGSDKTIVHAALTAAKVADYP